MQFDQYKKQFDTSFGKVHPNDFVKQMEALGYEFENIKINNTKMENLIKQIRNTKGIENLDASYPGLGQNVRVLCDEMEKQIGSAAVFTQQFQLGLNTLNKLKKPFKYDHFGQMVIDKDGQKILDIRGWGWIQKLDIPEQRMDSIGEMIAELLNTNTK